MANAGTRAVAYRTALGKAMLAHLSAERRNAVIESLVFQAFTPKTITSPEWFRAELEKIRKRGYAIDDEESVLGVRCLAAPVLNAEQEPIAALSISGPTARMTKHLFFVAPYTVNVNNSLPCYTFTGRYAKNPNILCNNPYCGGRARSGGGR